MIPINKRHIFLLLVFFLGKAYSQDQPFLKTSFIPDFMDTLFIDHDLNNYSFRIYSNYKINQFQFIYDNQRVVFSPNNPFGIGIGLATRKLIVDLGFNIKPRSSELTERFDLAASFMHKRHIVDFSLFSYRGYEAKGIDAQPFREDIHSFTTNVNYLYMFNAEQQSIMAMKSGLYRQKKFGIAVGVGLFLVYTNSQADSSMISYSYYPNAVDQGRITGMRGFGGGILLGTSFTVPIFKGLFITGSVMPGFGYMDKHVDTETGSYSPRENAIVEFDLSGILGYTTDAWYMNFTITSQASGTSLDYGNIAVFNSVNAKLAFGYKFRRKED